MLVWSCCTNSAYKIIILHWSYEINSIFPTRSILKVDLPSPALFLCKDFRSDPHMRQDRIVEHLNLHEKSSIYRQISPISENQMLVFIPNFDGTGLFSLQKCNRWNKHSYREITLTIWTLGYVYNCTVKYMKDKCSPWWNVVQHMVFYYKSILNSTFDLYICKMSH